MPSDPELSDARAVIVIGDDEAAIAAETAIAVNSLTAVRANFADATEQIADQPSLAAVMIETQQLTEWERLPAIVAAAEAARVRTIVVFADDWIDEAGALLGRDVVLLCDPDPVERAAALALAVAQDGLTVRDGASEAARLQRLNEEVARFAATIAKLSGRDDVGGGLPGGDTFVTDRTSSFAAAPSDVAASDIRRAIRARRLRDDAFDLTGLFEDPAWDMLLDLFAAELERQRVSVSSLCIAAAVPPTTALRWIGKLIEAGLLDRHPDDFDRRRAFLSLTARASTAMRNYVAALSRAGLSIA